MQWLQTNRMLHGNKLKMNAVNCGCHHYGENKRETVNITYENIDGIKNMCMS